MSAPGLPIEAQHVFPARIIGKHEWCMVVQPSRFHPGARVLEYYWRPLPVLGFEHSWKHCEQWPTYNLDDGCYGGMPRTLRNYWESHREAVRSWIDNGRPLDAASVPQMELAL